MLARWFNHLRVKVLLVLVLVRVKPYPPRLVRNLRQDKVQLVTDQHSRLGKSLLPQVPSLLDRLAKRHRLLDKDHKQFLVLNLHFRRLQIRMEAFKHLPELRVPLDKDLRRARLLQAVRNLLPVRLLLVKFLLQAKRLPDLDQQVRFQPVRHRPVKTLNFQKLKRIQVPEPLNFQLAKPAPLLVLRLELQTERLRAKNLVKLVKQVRPVPVLRQRVQQPSIPVLQRVLRLARTQDRREHQTPAPQRQIPAQQPVRHFRQERTQDNQAPLASAPQILQLQPFRKDNRIQATPLVKCQPVLLVPRPNCRLVRHSFQQVQSLRRQVTRAQERCPPIRRAPCKKLSIQMHQPSAPLPVPPSLRADKLRRFRQTPTRLRLSTSRSQQVQVTTLPAAALS